VVDLPAALGQPGDEGLGGDVGARQQDAADHVQDRVVRREDLEQSFGGLLAGGQEFGLDAELAHLVGGGLADAGDLDAAERARVQAVLLELLPDRLDGVLRGEHDPRVAAVDQALDGPLHLGRGARGLDGYGRHLAGDRAVGAQTLGHDAGLLLGARDEDLPAVQRTRLPPGELVPLLDAGPDGEDDLPGVAEGGLHEGVHGGGGGVLGLAGGVAGDGDGGLAGDPARKQDVAQRGQVGDVGGDGQAAASRGVGEGLRFEGGDVVDVDDRADRSGGHSRVDGDGLGVAHAGDDLEARLLGGGGFDLGLGEAVRVGVADDEAGDVLAFARGGGHEFTLVARGGFDQFDLAVVAGDLLGSLDQRLGQGPVVVDAVGFADGVEGALGQQSRIAWAGPDESHAAYQLTGTGHVHSINNRLRYELDFNSCSAPFAMSSSAIALPTAAASFTRSSSFSSAVVESLSVTLPSAANTAPRRYRSTLPGSAPSATSASAATGALHPASSRSR